MKKFNKILFATVAMVAGMSALNQASAQEWTARTADEIREDLQFENNGVSSYTLQWGDTLSALSVATGVPVETLAKINSVENINVIETGTVFFFNEDNTVLSVEKDHEVKSFDVNSAEAVETPEDSKQVIEEKEAATSQEATTTTQEETTQAAPETTVEETTAAPTTVQETTVEETTQAATTTAQASSSPQLYSLSQFMFNGVVNWNGLKFTYYSQSVLPGGGLNIPGRHVNADGYVADADGYIVLASSQPLGTVIDTPFGYQGKVYDRGTSGNHYDVYIR